MKKTITIAILLASAICAHAETLSLNPTAGTFSKENGTSSNTLTQTGQNTTYVSSFTTVQTNIGNGGSWTWTATFNLAEKATIDSLKAGVFTFNTGGLSQGDNDRKGVYTLSILDSAGSTTLATSNSQAVTYSGSGGSGYDWVEAKVDYATNSLLSTTWTNTSGTEQTKTASGKVLVYEPSSLTLEAGTYTLSLEIAKGSEQTSGYLAGLHSAQINYTPVSTAGDNVPEPATATLSLLALAGLAARRRRS